jgi:hypothetical protein
VEGFFEVEPPIGPPLGRLDVECSLRILVQEEMDFEMKKPKPKKIRKVWAIKPQSRIQKSTKRQLLERIKKREAGDSFER